jgi:hypothetical protein
MRKEKSRIPVLALLVFMAGLAGFSGQQKRQDLPPSDSLSLIKKPQITDVKHIWMGEPDVEMEFSGTGFGATRGTKKVRIDTTVALNYMAWGDTGISFGKPLTLIYWDHVYQFAIVDGSNVLSNVFSKRIPWDFDGIKPSQGPVGTVTEITVYQLSAAPNGFGLKIGGHDFPVVSWTGGVTFGKIKAKVPAGLAPGTYDVYLQKAGEVASEKCTFKVVLPVIHLPDTPIKK